MSTGKIAIPPDKQHALAEFLAEQFLDSVIVRCREYLRVGNESLRYQLGTTLASVWDAGDTVKISHTFDMVLSATMLAGHVRLMGGNPNAPGEAKRLRAKARPKRKKDAKERQK